MSQGLYELVQLVFDAHGLLTSHHFKPFLAIFGHFLRDVHGFRMAFAWLSVGFQEKNHEELHGLREDVPPDPGS